MDNNLRSYLIDDLRNFQEETQQNFFFQLSNDNLHIWSQKDIQQENSLEFGHYVMALFGRSAHAHTSKIGDRNKKQEHELWTLIFLIAAC